MQGGHPMMSKRKFPGIASIEDAHCGPQEVPKEDAERMIRVSKNQNDEADH
jgi:hypothetical protein